MADLKQQMPARFEMREGFGDEAAIEGQAIRARVERRRRLVVAHLGLQCLAGGYVGRIGDDAVEALAVEAGEEIGDEKTDGIRRAERVRILLSDGERGGGDIGRRDGASGNSSARVMARMPEPVPMSKMRKGRMREGAGRIASAASTRCSVSGRGISTSRLTMKLRP